MRHCDPEVLALLALGDGEPSPADRVHLDGCLECRRELEALSGVVRTGRDAGRATELSAPPTRVWQGIADELGVDPDLLRDTGYVPTRRRWARRTALVAVAAAAVGVLVGGAGGWALTRGLTHTSTTGQVVAQASLRPLNAPQASGTAVVSATNAQREITVRVTGLPVQPHTFYEVWLLDRQAGKLVSLGVLSPGETGTFVIPQGLDLGQYPVVDVSLQVLDGNPKHSGNSVVRGLLS